MTSAGARSDYPDESGFWWPAEWQPHRRTWICWPARSECFGGGENLLRAKQAVARLALAIAAFEPVTVAVRPEDAPEAKLATAGRVELMETPLDDGWARDIGPTFVIGPQAMLAGVKWNFNAWGHKYHPYTHDAMFARRVLELAGARSFAAPIVCEGGAIHGDGEGTVLTTEQCLLNTNRNPGLRREDVATVLDRYLGIRKVIWVRGEFSDSETDGHIDNIACFAGPGRVIVGVPDSPGHPDGQPVREAIRMLAEARDARGRPLEVISLPQPRNRHLSWSGHPLQASYVNFCFANSAVVMPGFDDPNDEPARKIIRDVFAGRQIVQVAALDIVQGGGGIHCMTQQEPAP